VTHSADVSASSTFTLQVREQFQRQGFLLESNKLRQSIAGGAAMEHSGSGQVL
jgi:hypothetical protein